MTDIDPRGTIHRIDGHLHRRIPILDSGGNVVEHVLRPLMVELHARDIAQIFVGASMLAIPVGFTEETWDLGRTLPLANVIALAVISVAFTAFFIHLHFYRGYLTQYAPDFVKRVLAVYAISLIVVGVLLTVIQQCPWATDWVLAVKRVVIVAFPASLSATVADALK
jgi:uncharacterized membrane protein